MKENKLYPLKFTPCYKDKIWGGDKIRTVLNKDFGNLPNCGESWELSGVPGNISVVENGFLQGNTLEEIIEVYMGDLIGEAGYDQYGLSFPLLIKFIDATDNLSIQVHPDDNMAKERHNSFGKTEMWYVLHAEPGAKLISGFKQEVTKQEYIQRVENNTITEVLNAEEVQAGDVFFIPAGRVHAIGKGILLAEIQQTSDVTYRIYDYDRTDDAGNRRELHTEQAVDAIDFSVETEYKSRYTSRPNESVNMVKCPYFSTQIIALNQSVDKDYAMQDSFVIYLGVEGDTIISGKEFDDVTLRFGETVLIPAAIEQLTLTPQSGKSKLLEVYL